MGKKTSSSQPSQADAMSPTFEAPRMDPPPPYDTVTRSSTSSSVRSVDRLNPGATGPSQTQQNQTTNADTTRGVPVVVAMNGGRGGVVTDSKGRKHRKDGGCCNVGENVGGCMNNGDGADGCMNYGDGSDGCMNYQSPAGCMNYRSTGGCMNYEVDGDWEGNEGCMNYRRGGGCCLYLAL